MTSGRTVALNPVTLERCLKSRYSCEPDQIEYWDGMIVLSAKRESILVKSISVRAEWESEQWTKAWCVVVSEHLVVNRADGCWTITHVPTGLAAGSASSLKVAVRIANEVSHWPEWAFLQGKDDITPEFRCKANDAFNSVAS
jgi:hypothetical protein